ncbi:DUF4260 domain-containing protein (plasmid) [Alkalihalobacillus hwajinpoensis]|uniref:DUF4260 domain-containing protein n=1 Tax=Guptibacillus hwajinpoensis TaxID=208199 RepID=UPI001884307D|nr:DUF4260 domain-containing protein [Pseudalkalibacillus hwajinpoensis]MBF0706791.1 DUF4260 domain-containing protein [Pseudalkalibacillus hwajinpoensis]
MSKSLLHIEVLIVLLVSVYFYASIDASWWLVFLCLLVPDLSMLGYVINNSIGSTIYNFGHKYVIPLILIILSVILHQDLMLALCIIWVAHIGMDRTIGYGLKYPSNFKDTHLQKV